MSEDLHSPTTAGPTPPPTTEQPASGATSATEKAADAASTAQAKVTDTASAAQAKVTDTASAAQAKASDAAATAQAKVADVQTAVTDKPEVQVGLAFAGAFVAAKVLRAITGGGR